MLNDNIAKISSIIERILTTVLAHFLPVKRPIPIIIASAPATASIAVTNAVSATAELIAPPRNEFRIYPTAKIIAKTKAA